MTVEKEIKTLTTVLKETIDELASVMLASGRESSGRLDDARSLLDTIDAADDEPERKPCAYNTHKVSSNRAVILGRWSVAGCIDCGTIMRKELGVINGDAEWDPWPEGGAK